MTFRYFLFTVFIPMLFVVASCDCCVIDDNGLDNEILSDTCFVGRIKDVSSAFKMSGYRTWKRLSTISELDSVFVGVRNPMETIVRICNFDELDMVLITIPGDTITVNCYRVDPDYLAYISGCKLNGDIRTKSDSSIISYYSSYVSKFRPERHFVFDGFCSDTIFYLSRNFKEKQIIQHYDSCGVRLIVRLLPEYTVRYFKAE